MLFESLDYGSEMHFLETLSSHLTFDQREHLLMNEARHGAEPLHRSLLCSLGRGIFLGVLTLSAFGTFLSMRILSSTSIETCTTRLLRGSPSP
jgi:hypothetical protein